MDYTLSMFSKDSKLWKLFSRGEFLFQLSAVLTGNGPKETSTKANVKSCTLGGITPYNKKGWRQTDWRAALQQMSWGFC